VLEALQVRAASKPLRGPNRYLRGREAAGAKSGPRSPQRRTGRSASVQTTGGQSRFRPLTIETPPEVVCLLIEGHKQKGPWCALRTLQPHEVDEAALDIRAGELDPHPVADIQAFEALHDFPLDGWLEDADPSSLF